MVATATGAAFAPMPGGAWREGPKRVSNVKATEVVHAPVVSPSPVELVCEALPSLSVGKRQPAASPTESPPPTLQHQYELEATRQSAPPVIVGQSASPVPILSVSADVSRPLNSDLQASSPRSFDIHMIITSVLLVRCMPSAALLYYVTMAL